MAEEFRKVVSSESGCSLVRCKVKHLIEMVTIVCPSCFGARVRKLPSGDGEEWIHAVPPLLNCESNLKLGDDLWREVDVCLNFGIRRHIP